MEDAWLKAAEEDALVARSVGSIAPGAAAFHWQQAAEKLLKALLAAAEVDIPRTHDLVYLWKALVSHEILPEADVALLDRMRRVGRLGTLGRYPIGGAPPSQNITLADLQEAEEFYGDLSALARRSLQPGGCEEDGPYGSWRDRSP